MAWVACPVNGPGRTKILIIAEQDWREHLDVIVDSIAGLGGIACVNATAVLYEGNPAPLAHAIGERLAALRPPPNVDEKATLPTTPIANARALSDFLGRKAVRAQAVLGADQIIADLGDGYAPLRPDRARSCLDPTRTPSTSSCQSPACGWRAGHARTASLIDQLVAEPTITNVYRGAVPTLRRGSHTTATWPTS